MYLLRLQQIAVPKLSKRGIIEMTQSKARYDALDEKFSPSVFSGDHYYITIKIMMIDVHNRNT
jgi:hypothetical protein